MRLPIDAIRPEFERRMAEARRLVVTAETGAGKSTRVPVWLAETLEHTILVVEPRRVACIALAEYLSAQAGAKVGGYFGSRVRFSDRSGPNTRVLFCTPGVALRILTGPMKLGAIVVDEFHERPWQMDLVVTAATSLPRFADLPLILTSATIDAEAAATVLDAGTLHATGRTFPVNIRYDHDSIEPSTRDIGPRVAKVVLQALREHEGDVLVFLPGLREIRAVESCLGRGTGPGRDNEEVLIVHGSQSPAAMRRVFQESTRRRIYLSTNVAETSITLPGVRVVIDSGMAKTRLHRAGRAVLVTVPIPQASMQQRAGRAGRVAAGTCIRLWSERFQAEPYLRPEIERVELDDLLLQAAELGLVGETLEKATWITPPPAFAVQAALSRLHSLAAVDDSGLTERGRRLARLPVSASEAALLVGAPPKIDASLCDLVAILQTSHGFLLDTHELPPSARAAVQDARIELLSGVADEVTTQIRLLRDGDASTHHLNRRRLDEARSISRQLRELIAAPMSLGQGSFEATKGLAGYILERLPAVGFVKRPRASKQRSRSEPWANGTIEVKLYPFVPIDPGTQPTKSQAALILETEWLSSAGGVFGIGRMVLPTEPTVLAAAGLGESTYTRVRLDKKSRRKIKISAVRQVQLAGVTLASGEQELSGADLRGAIATFILENRLFKGAGDEIRDALHAWDVLANWKGEPLDEYPNVPGPVPEQTDAWIAGRLATLGLETTADLELIDSGDLVPDLAAETGIPEWIAAPIRNFLPRTWNHNGGVYSCTVSSQRRTVQLEPMDQAAKKIKEPPAGALPGFHGFRVTYKQGSRRLTLR